MSENKTAPVGAPPAGGDSTGAIELKDSRTGKAYQLPIMAAGVEGDTAIRGMDLRQVKQSAGEFGLMSYDPAFMNTASCKSAITFIDGEKGISPAHPIERSRSSDLFETAWLLPRASSHA